MRSNEELFLELADGDPAYHTSDCVYQDTTDDHGYPIPYGTPGCSCPGTAERLFIEEVRFSTRSHRDE